MWENLRDETLIEYFNKICVAINEYTKDYEELKLIHDTLYDELKERKIKVKYNAGVAKWQTQKT